MNSLNWKMVGARFLGALIVSWGFYALQKGIYAIEPLIFIPAFAVGLTLLFAKFGCCCKGGKCECEKK